MLDDLVAAVYSAIATWLISEYVLGDLIARLGL
jgi:hypothetical protein